MHTPQEAGGHGAGHDAHHHGVVVPAPPGFVPHVVAHHFDTAEAEFSADKLAMWLFLATEVLLFGGLFAAYFYYHGVYPETFKVGGHQLNWRLGALNTLILLFSSYTMAMGVRAAQLSQKALMQKMLGITVLCGLGFLVVKYFEYAAKVSHGLVPARWFSDHDHVMAGVENGHLFFNFYWTMTAIHGLHVLIGMLLILWVMKGGAKGRFYGGYYLPVDLVGLYWHLVDLIWIFLFPLLYLVP
ncbi:MAG: cytochrome c oxidase subunit 3 family protein [Planctomycetes bacterium]|nr:cytochrome c oxidase subunit 3 family protein [Planctomycetota bacterium]